MDGEILGSHVVRMDPIDMRHRICERDQMSAVGAHDALWVAGRAGRVKHVERVVGVHWNGVVRFRVSHLRLVIQFGKNIVRLRSYWYSLQTAEVLYVEAYFTVTLLFYSVRSILLHRTCTKHNVPVSIQQEYIFVVYRLYCLH